MDQSDSAYHQIRRRNRNALSEQSASHFTKPFRTRMIEIQHAYVLQQICYLLEQWSRIIDMVGACIKLSDNNSRNE